MAPTFEGAWTENVPYPLDWGWISVEGGGSATSSSIGGHGRILIETINQNFTGRYFPDWGDVLRITRLVPSTPFLPSDSRVPGWPEVKIITVDGISVNTEASGSFTTPDVVFNGAASVPVSLQTRNVPVGASLKINIYAQGLNFSEVTATYTSGNESLATWTANITFPSGFAKGYLQATW